MCHLLVSLSTRDLPELPPDQLKESSCRHISQFLAHTSVQEDEEADWEREELRALAERARESLERAVQQYDTGAAGFMTLLGVFRESLKEKGNEQA